MVGDPVQQRILVVFVQMRFEKRHGERRAERAQTAAERRAVSLQLDFQVFPSQE